MLKYVQCTSILAEEEANILILQEYYLRTYSASVAVAFPGFEVIAMLGHLCASRFLNTPLIKYVLEGSWLTKKAILHVGQVAMRNLLRERILEASKSIVGSSC